MKMLLSGEWVDRDKTIDVLDPFDNSIGDTVPRATAADVDVAMAAAAEGVEIARRMTVFERFTILSRTAEIVRARNEEFAKTSAREGSQPRREARKEAARCVNTLTVSAEESKRVSGETVPLTMVSGRLTVPPSAMDSPVGSLDPA